MKHRNEMKIVNIVCALTALALTLVPKSEAQAVPIPIALTPIIGNGAATTATTTYCATNIPIYYKPNAGYVQQNEGDGCPASQDVMGAPGGVAVDSYGNVFFTDQQHYTVRVIYKGGAAVASAIAAANVMNFYPGNVPVTAASLIPGNVYLIAGSYSSATVLGGEVGPLTPYYCNQNASGATPNPSSSPLAGCPAGYAYLAPESIALDGDGNVFLTTQSGRHAVMVVYISGSKAAKLIQAATTGITTVNPGFMYVVAGTNNGSTVGVYTADGPLATNISMDYPRGIYIDANENVYYADQENNLVRKVNGTSDAVTTIAGVCTLPPADTAPPYTSPCESAAQLGLTTSAAQGDGGPATAAHFNYVYAVTLDANGNLFIADSGANQSTTTTPATPAGVIPGRVRVVYAGGTLPGISGPLQVGYIYTYAGGGSSIATNSPALNVAFDEVEGLSTDSAGYLYVTDHRKTSATSNRIWRIDPVTGTATIIVGVPSAGLTTATLPTVVNCNTNTTTAGPGPAHNDKFGSGCPAAQTPVNGPIGSFVFDKFGNAYLADSGYDMIHEYTYNNIFPATNVGISSGSQYVAFDVPAGAATNALGFGVEANGDTEFADANAANDTCTAIKVFAADTICSYGLKFTPTAVGARYGMIQLKTATGVAGSQFLSGIGVRGVLTIDPGTPGTLGSGVTPSGVAVDQLGNAYISDSKGNQVLQLPTGGGTATPVITGLSSPGQVAVDGQGTVYVADTGNNRIVSKPFGGTTIYLGTGLKSPKGVAVDFDGNIFVADTGNGRVVELAAVTRNQTTLTIDAATFGAPSSLSIDAAGDLFVVDATAKGIVELPMSGGQQVLTIQGVLAPVSAVADLAGNLFIVDGMTKQVFELPAGATSPLVALTALNTAVGIAVDTAGTLYVADLASSSITTVNRTNSTTVFPQTDIKAPGGTPLTYLLSSSGNASVLLSNPLDTNTNASVFPITAGSSNGCSPSETLVGGTSCQATGTFNPTVTGTQSATVTFPSTANSVTINETGKAVNLILTTVTLSPAATAPTATITVGSSVTITAAITPTGTETGTVIFSVDGAAQAPTVTLPTALKLVVSGLALGTHSVCATYSGDSVYGSSTGCTAIVVVKIPTSVSGIVTPGSGGPTIAASVVPLSANGLVLTGTITFSGPNLTTQTYQFNNAVTTTLNLPDGANSVVITYNGDSNFASSTTTLIVPIQKVATLLKFPVSTTTVSGTTTTTFPGLIVTDAGVRFPTSLTISSQFTANGIIIPPTGQVVIQVTTTSVTPNVTTGAKSDTLGTFTANGDGTYTFAYTSSGWSNQLADTNSLTASTPTYVATLSYAGDGNYETPAAVTIPLIIYHVPTNTPITVTRGMGGSVVSGTIAAGTTAAPTTYYTNGNTSTPYPCNTCSPAISTAAQNPNFTGTVKIYRTPAAGGTATLASTITLVTTANGYYNYVDMVAADGPYTFYAVYSGDGNYGASTSTTGSITVLHAPTATSVAVGGGGVNGIPAVQVTATVTSTTPGAIGGTANFYNNGTLLGSAPIVNGVAVYPTGQLNFTNWTFSASYLGDGNYLPSNSGTVTEGIDLAIAPTTATTFTVAYQAQYPIGFVLGSIDGYSGTLTPSCSGLPVNTICRFDNQSLVVAPGVTPTSNLQIYASINPATASLKTRSNSYFAIVLSWSAGIGLLLIVRRRQVRWKIPVLLSLVLLLALPVGISGCGQGTQSSAVFITPAGTVPITVTYTDANHFSRSVVLTVTFLAGP